MKYIYHVSLIALVSIVLFASCKEVAPPIDMTVPVANLIDSTFLNPTPAAAQPRIALVEEFTGLKCPNCPEGHAIVETYNSDNPGRLSIVRIVNYFADPHSLAKEDYMTAQGDNIYAKLGSSLAWPCAAKDRILHGSETDIVNISKAQWETYLDARLATPTQVNLNLTSNYDLDTRQVIVSVEAEYTGAVTDDNFLSIMITEGGITDVQDNTMGTIENYNHEHMLRDMLTPTSGVSLNAEPKVAGRTYIKEFAYTVPAAYDPNNMEIVAFVHKDGSEFDVMQSAHIDLN